MLTEEWGRDRYDPCSRSDGYGRVGEDGDEGADANRQPDDGAHPSAPGASVLVAVTVSTYVHQ